MATSTLKAEWKLITETIGSNSITLPNDWTEILAIPYITDSVNNGYGRNIIIMRDFFATGTHAYMYSGHYRNSTVYSECMIEFTETNAKLSEFYDNGENKTSNARTRYYYK